MEHSITLKRLFDIILSLCSMVLFAIPICIIWVAVLCSGGKTIFRQVRVGYRGRLFTLYKFRTMTQEAEETKRPQLCVEEDERTTRVGRFLRAHHLDEFPQLWNILRGDMSFVGPRPEQPYFVEQIIAQRPDYVRLYALRPGIFSMATLYNGYTYNMEKMIRRLDMDLDYLEHRSFRLDIKIIWLTATSILTGKQF